MNLKKRLLAGLFFLTQISFAQEGLPVYSDYLTDNYYLIHPSMAGAANCAKIRVTARQQWFGQDDAPALQTASINAPVGERSGLGAILFNDRNGYHSQKGVKLTYAHHIMFSRDAVDLNQLSFGMSVGLIQSNLDESTFLNNGDFDPNIGGITQKDSYMNVDIGASYNYLDFYAHVTVKNALETKRELYSDYENMNIRRFLVSAGYVFGGEYGEGLQWEPSVLFSYVDQTKEKSFDANLKVYKELDFGKVWGGLSYRRSFDGAQYDNGSGLKDQYYQSISPLVGVNFGNWMVAYTYSHIAGKMRFAEGGYHQITLGFNFLCKRGKYHCNCPAIN